MRPFFKDFYDSGFTEKWFSIAANSLITAATIVVWREGSAIAGVFSLISYLCLVVQTTHGTRKSYEFLKDIYVYRNPSKFRSSIFDSVFVLFRLHVITAPVLLVWWAYASGKVPF
ncbi:TPA: hypothetical protein ACX3GO_004472 [Vibrio parahaemolyticus]|nr:hypothetical protein [Vibrio parahaemolyticus]